MMTRLKHVIRNQRGDAMIVAIIVAGMSLLSSLMMMNYANQVHKVSRNPRIKSMMTALEAKVRMELLRPTSYNCTGSGRSNCALINSKITSLGRNVAGAQCWSVISGGRTPILSPTNCGFRVTVESFAVSAGLSRATVRIRYEGNEMPMRDTNVIMDIPADIMQSVSNGIYQCPESAPKFLGFHPDGRLNCVSVTGSRALPGQFINAIASNDLTTSKYDLPSRVDCGAGNIVSYVDWGSGGTQFNHHCQGRPDPFSKFGFTPQEATPSNNRDGRVSYTKNPDYP